MTAEQQSAPVPSIAIDSDAAPDPLGRKVRWRASRFRFDQLGDAGDVDDQGPEHTTRTSQSTNA